MDYTTLGIGDQLMLARDTLRAKESDYFRLSIAPESGSAGRLEELEKLIESLKVTVTELEGQQEQPPAKPKPRARRKTTKKETE